MQQRAKAQDLLKWIAMLTMVIDHLRFVFPDSPALIIIGRFAFPLFCLAIAANVQRLPSNAAINHQFPYLFRLGIFALISELPYRLLRPDADTLNIMPTLLLGLLICFALHYQSRVGLLLAVTFSGLALLLHPWLMYGALGVLLPAACLAGLRYGHGFILLAMLLSALCNTSFDTLSTGFNAPNTTFNLHQCLLLFTALMAPALGILLLRQPIRFAVYPVTGWGYWFYPAHLLIIYLIKIFKYQ